MESPTKKVLIDSSYGNISKINSKDEVILVGVHPFEGISYVDNIELILKPENSDPITVNIKYSGYNMQLFLGDFTGDNKSEIMVRGGFGGSGGFEIGVIYKYEDGKLIEIFNQDIFYKNNNCSATFKDDYKVSVNCGKKKYTIDISSKEKEYMEYLYLPNGKLKNAVDAYVDAPNGIFPIKQIYNNYYELLIQQRVVGISNADTLGIIQTYSNLIDSNIKNIYKGLLLTDYNYRKRQRYNKFITEKDINNYAFKNLKGNYLNRNSIYSARDFKVKKDSMNLIVNNIFEEKNTLYIDGYLINLTEGAIEDINNFEIELKDAFGRVFARKIFKRMDINGGLEPFEGKKILLTFFGEEYNLYNINTSNVTWGYDYEII